MIVRTRILAAACAAFSSAAPAFASAMPAMPGSPGARPAALSASRNLPCARTSIASVRAPSGPAAYQHGTLRLSNGASVWIEGASTEPQVIQALHMSPGDAVAACYGPPREYADAGDARAITVLDLKTSGSYGNVVGNWPNAR